MSKASLAAAAAALVVVIVFAIRVSHPSGPPPADAPSGAPPSAPADGAAATPLPPVPPEPAPPPEAIPAAPFEAPRAEAAPDSAPAESGAIVRGRCVLEASGDPVAGCTAALTFNRGRDSVQGGGRSGGATKWEGPPKQATPADGRFEFRLAPAPPPGYAFFLGISGEGLADADARLGRIEAGQTVDLGDIRMEPGILVEGRITDDAGTALGRESVSLRLKKADVRREKAGPREYANAISDPDGTFRVHWLLRAGTWSVEVRERELAGPAEFEVKPPEARLAIVVAADAPESMIQGTVVDDAGTPVKGAAIELDVHRSGWMLSSDGEGRFVVKRRRGDPDGPFHVFARKDGFESARSPAKAPWGTRDLRIVMERGAPLAVSVVDGDTGEPVEDFGVACVPVSRDGRRSAEDMRVRFRGRHEGGVLTIPQLPRGPTWVIVAPGDSAYLSSPAHRVDIGPTGAPPLQVQVFKPVEALVRLKSPEGVAIPGSGVEIVRRVGDDPFTLVTHVLKKTWQSSDLMPQVLEEGTTDAEGCWRFAGPPGEPLGLRALGPGHVPTARTVTLARGGGPIDVVVSAGARLEGRISPARFVAEVQPEPDEDGKVPSFQRPGFTLLNPARPGERFPLDGTGRIELSEDGAFAAAGVPPGTWNLVLVHPVGGGTDVRTTAELTLRENLAFADGATVRLDLDLSHLLRARLRAAVVLNGEPFRKHRVWLTGQGPPPARERFGQSWSPMTGDDGRFELVLWPGEYRAGVSSRDSWLADPRPLIVAPAEAQEATVTFEGAPVDLRLLASDGQAPVAGLCIRLEHPAMDTSWTSPPSDAEGRIRMAALSRGPTFGVHVLPNRYATAEALDEFWRREQRQPESVRIGSLTAVPGAAPVEFVLPASAGW